MRVLATARPNEKYENIKSIQDMILETRLINNEIHYFETHTKKPDWIVEIKESTVFALFGSPDIPIHDRPFLIHENREFYIVLKRKFHPEAYQKLKRKKYEEFRLSSTYTEGS